MKTRYPDTYASILKFCRENGIPEKFAERYHFMPPERIDHVVAKFIRRRDRKVNKAPLAPKSRKPYNRHSSRRRQLEIQRYRCAYDHYEMVLDNPQHPRYATIEHVIKLSDGGSAQRRNVVMACSVCNNLRDIMKMTAFEFYDWAQEHKDEIERWATRWRFKSKPRIKASYKFEQ